MQLFRSRLKRQWKVYYRLFKSIADWTIYLYLIFPLAAFIYYLLRETVFKLDYGFLEWLHPGILILLIIYVGISLTNRTFSEPADKLFLIQNTKQYAALKRWSFYYSLLCNLVIMGILFSLVYPLFRYVHQFSYIQMFQFAISMLVGYLLGKIVLLLFSKWEQFFIQLLLVLILSSIVFFGNMWSIVCSLIIGLLSIFLYEKMAIQTHRFFEKQTRNDVEAFYRWHSRIFFTNPELKNLRIPVHKAKAPLLFKQSKSKNNVSVLIELILKTIFRKKNYLWNYFRMISIVFPLVWVLPWWGAYLLIIFMYFGLKTYMGAVFLEIKDNAIFNIIHTSDQNWAQAIKKVEIYIISSVTLFYFVIITCRIFFL